MAVCIEVRVRSNLIAALSLDNVSDPLTLANATWLSVSRKSPVNPIAALSLDNVSASERCP